MSRVPREKARLERRPVGRGVRLETRWAETLRAGS